MGVTRIVANLAAPDPAALAQFYREVFELDLTLDMGWVAFLASDASQAIELHTASQGGSGTPLPVISIGVDDLAAMAFTCSIEAETQIPISTVQSALARIPPRSVRRVAAAASSATACALGSCITTHCTVR